MYIENSEDINLIDMIFNECISSREGGALVISASKLINLNKIKFYKNKSN